MQVTSGYLENCKPCTLQMHATDVHKPLISACRMAVKGGLMGIIHPFGGHLIHMRSTLGCKIRDLLWKELTRDASQEFVMLYFEDGVYNFYMQGEDYEWKAYNYDTGAAASVAPRHLEAVCPLSKDVEMIGPTPSGAGSPAQGVRPSVD